MKSKKILILIISTVLIITVISIILLNVLKKQKINNQTKTVAIDEDIYVEKLEQTKEFDSVEAFVNHVLKVINSEYEDEKNGGSDVPMLNEHVKLLKEFNLETPKNYYAKNSYKVQLNKKNTIYFTEGYLINSSEKNSAEKQKVKLTILKDDENKACKIEIYGQNYKNLFNYEDDIEKVTIKQQNAKTIDISLKITDFSSEQFDK